MLDQRLARRRLLEAVDGPRRDQRLQLLRQLGFGPFGRLIGIALLPGAGARNQQLARLQPGQLLAHGADDVVAILQLRRGELAGGDLRVGHARALPIDDDGGDVVGPPLVQHLRLQERARRDDALDAALHGAAPRRFTDLLGDGDAVALVDQLGDVAGGGVMRDARHGHARALRDRARGERDVQLPRHQFCVLVEGLVEVAEAEEQDGIGMLALQSQVLFTERGRFLFAHGGIIPRNG